MLRRTILNVGGVALLAFFKATVAHSGSPRCSHLGEWIQRMDRSLVAADYRERTRLNEEEWGLRVSIANHFFEQFQADSFDKSEIDSCLGGKAYAGNFINTLNKTFYEGSLAKLLSGRSEAFRAFANLIHKKREESRLPFFRISGLLGEKSPAAFEAGYHIGVDSIYIDIGRTRRNRWYVRFMHEVVHGLDDLVFPAVRKYSDPEKFGKFKSWAEKTSDPASLPSADREEFFDWISAGLERGLWMEYRASLISVLLYLEGVKEGLWDRDSEMDEILATKPAHQRWEHFVYHYLDDHYQPRENALYQSGLFGNALQELRNRYRRENLLPSLGGLSSVAKAAYP